MLSGEGNAGERWKTTIRLISKKTKVHVQYTVLYISLSLFSTTTASNFQKLLSYTFNGVNVVRVLVHFFSPPLIFTLYLIVGRSHFVTAATNKKKRLLFLYLALYLCRPFSRLASLVCRLLSLSLYSKFVDMTIKLNT